ncbi:hypothetical protein [Streptomyces sp. NPDC059631]|uniref:hypothetical protein n=1 Tax=unclassified Streptomyces TaxID=2593676 RepID=UPI00367C7D66
MTTQSTPEPSTPAEGDRYVKRTEPDAGRIVTVTSVWTDEDGHTAVAYTWRDGGQCGSACPLDVFQRGYRPATEQAPADRLALIDARDAHAFVIIRPALTDPDNVMIEAGSRGMSRAAAAYALRQTADRFDEKARAEGDEPIPYPAVDPAPAAAPSTATAVLYEAMRRIANAEQDHELDPGRGDSRSIIRTLLAEVEAQQPAAAEESPADAARRLAEQITTLGKARGWSTWAADFIHPDREFVDPGEPVSPSADATTWETRAHTAGFELGQARAQRAELDERITRALDQHTKHDDSQHCQHDSEPWPCPTVAALTPAAKAQQS